MAIPFKILRADHTGITVRDLDRALAFWRDTLGFALSYRGRRDGTYAAQVTGVPGATIEIAVLLAPGHKIELLQYTAPEGRESLRPRPCDTGSVHLAFDIDDLDAALAHLATLGWTATGTPQIIAEGPGPGPASSMCAMPTARPSN